MKLFPAVLCGLLLAAAAPATGVGVLAQETHVLVITGLGGEPEFRDRFHAWGATLHDTAVEAGVPRERIHFLAEDPDVDPERIRARSTREEVEEAFREIGETASPEDRVLIFLAGHGSGSGERSRVSLPGPSLTAADYAALVEGLPVRSVALVNAASASGDFVPVLAGDGRVVITATRSARQRNAAIFGEHFVAGFEDGVADLDRDGRVSLLEAFEYARLETERHYEEGGLIPTEQALLDDTGSGSGVTDPDEAPEVGAVASRFFLGADGAAVGADDRDEETEERLRALYAERERLEEEMAELTRRRETDDAAVQEELEALLVELARIGEEIRELEGGGG